MSRSEYVYVVDWHGPVAAFTTRWELVHWLKNHPEYTEYATVWRVRGSDQRFTSIPKSELGLEG